MLSKLLLSGLILSVGPAGLAIAEQGAEPVKGTAVTLTGCVVDGKDNSYVLTHVSEVSGPGPTTPAPTVKGMSGMQDVSGQEVMYWLRSDSIKLVKEHVGHKVEVTGIITDESAGSVRFKQEPGKSGPDNKLEVKTGGKEVSAKTEKPIKPMASSKTKSDETQAMPVRQVKIDALKMVAATCP